MMNRNRNSILIVDDEKLNIIALTHILTEDYTVYAAKNGSDALEIAAEYLPDVILLDVLMPEMDGFEVLSRLKSNEQTKEIPVIFVTGLNTPEGEAEGLALGAADYISKPYSSAIVKLRIRNQIQMLNLLNMTRHLSVTDQLTGISNRRDFDYRMRLEWERASRDRSFISLLLIDIDKFKAYNDSYGHLQGDSALQIIAEVIACSLKRSVDFVARWGGEEFAVLLPATALSGALSVAEHIRKNVEHAPIPRAGGPPTRVTVSIGVNSCIPEPETLGHEFVIGADQALYDAKAQGRNKASAYRGVLSQEPADDSETPAPSCDCGPACECGCQEGKECTC